MDLTGMGKQVTVICSKGVLLIFANMDGSRFAVLSAEDGTLLWEKKAQYFRRPVVIGDTIYTLPSAFDLHTGKPRMRVNPITGEESPLVWSKAYGCGAVSASRHAMLFRSGSLAYYDVTQDTGVGNFGGLKPNCWISQIAAAGLWLAPEGSAGCTCGYPIRSTVAMRPAAPTETAWTCYVTGIATTPVKHLAVNFGAPGDRRDSTGRVWFAWPRPKSSFGLKLKLKTDVAKDMGYFTRNPKTTPIDATDKPWVYCSGCRGLLKVSLPLLEKNQGPRKYTVRLHFVEPDSLHAQQRVFDIRLQGQTVLKNFDILKTANAPNKAVVKEFADIEVTDRLTVELVPRTAESAPTQGPVIAGIEVCL